jgi:hypothetical protein
MRLVAPRPLVCLASLFLLGPLLACEPPDGIDGRTARASASVLPMAPTRAVDYRGEPPPLPAGTTLLVNPNRQLVGPPAAEGRVARSSTSYDAGLVHVVIWSCNNPTPLAHPAIQCKVDPDYVLVGGGAWATYGGAGGLLTASFPADPNVLMTWEGRSKDHVVSDPHILIVYAIGLKLGGVSRSALLGQMFVNRATSATIHHPEMSAPNFNGGIITTSVGCFVDWHIEGNLLMQCDETEAASKDLWRFEEASITHYRLGIAEQLPNFGTLERFYFVSADSTQGTGPREARVSVPSGYVPTGVAGRAFLGAASNFSDGRFLTRMAPFTETAQAAAAGKDHLSSVAGFSHLDLFALRKAP